MNNDIALAIINEAKSHEIIDLDIPETENQQQILAEELLIMAKEAWDDGNRSEAVSAIHHIAELQEKTEQAKQPQKNNELHKMQYLESIKENELPIPPEIEIEIPDIPLDLTNLSDREIMRLHGVYNACSARANWLYAQEEAGESAAKKIADHIYNEWVVSADKIDAKSKKPKTKDVLYAEAILETDSLGEWWDTYKTHATSAKKYSRLRDIYDNNCDRLSRQWTMRTEEKEHSR